jgi:hypothetical protein
MISRAEALLLATATTDEMPVGSLRLIHEGKYNRKC